MPVPAALVAILKPLLANGLGLVANAVMAKGKDYVEQKLGVELKPDMTADEIIRLKTAEMEHEEELARLKLEENKLDLQELDMFLKDTDSARDREVQIVTSAQAPLLNKIVTPVLALILLTLTFVLFGIVMFDNDPVEPSRKDILIYILGVLSAVSTQVVSYYFGSSQGSKDKGDQLKEIMK
jgi:membrane-bound ClpP family serine protease